MPSLLLVILALVSYVIGNSIVADRHPVYSPDVLSSLEHACIKYSGKNCRGSKLDKRQMIEAQILSNQAEYMSPIKVGGQLLQVVFDTGSSDFWLVTGPQPPAFNTARSLTFRTIPNASWSARYGDGSSSSGIVGSDQVEVGGVTIQNQIIGLSDPGNGTGDGKSGLSVLESRQIAGILGCAFKKINSVKPSPVLNVFENAVPILTQPMMAVGFDEDGNRGRIDWGYVDKSRFVGDLKWTQVDSSAGYWDVPVDNMWINGIKTRLSTSKGTVDTGTTLILLSRKDLEAFYGLIPGASRNARFKAWTFPANSSIPQFEISVGGYRAVVPTSFICANSVENGE
ncbi:MAG: hypothetical protein M1814_003384 [Vezdaea aestivalis]|nr:MAG: hypothetical protein M1814_003384 [Vezdaea aestivalis]